MAKANARQATWQGAEPEHATSTEKMHRRMAIVGAWHEHGNIWASTTVEHGKNDGKSTARPWQEHGQEHGKNMARNMARARRNCTHTYRDSDTLCATGSLGLAVLLRILEKSAQAQRLKSIHPELTCNSHV